jgi:hypothetical protein
MLAMKRWALALGLALALALPATAADLNRLRRPPAREPAYRGQPRYCLLVFGPEAQTRVWLVQDGDVLYVDRNANGDLTEQTERVTLPQGSKGYRVFEAGDIRHGGLTHKELSVGQFQVSPEIAGSPGEFKRIKGRHPEAWVWTVRVAGERPTDDRRPLPRWIKYVANGDGLGYLVFADRPEEAPVIHFNGPWTLGLQDTRQCLTAGYPSRLQIGVGTPGAGPGTFAFIQYPDTIPQDAYPAAEITFPPKAPGHKPIQARYMLTRRC